MNHEQSYPEAFLISEQLALALGLFFGLLDKNDY